VTVSASDTARARARAELTAEILAAAGYELADVGPAALSLRSVARRLDLVPSALYRYYESRDALLTALIIEAYEDVGEVAALASATRGSTLERWLAVCDAVRAWSAEHPQRWSLIYGSPVPGYAAPEETVGAAMKIVAVMSALVHDAPGRPAKAFRAAPDLDPVVEPIRVMFFPDRPAHVIGAAVATWTALLGSVSLERFGHFKGATTDFDPFFAYQMEAAGRAAGLR
jgi:AcrR family transcriptional regulator